MNPFYNISPEKGLPAHAFELSDLGSQRIFAITGKRVRGDWGEPAKFKNNTTYIPVESVDYDNQFVSKMLRIKLPYKIDELINHHFKYYLDQNPSCRSDFLNHMQFVILPSLKKKVTNTAYADCFELWLEKQNPKPNPFPMNTVNNTINLGDVNAPIQFQQNSDHSVQSQHNHLQKEQANEILELIRKDIEQLDGKIRADFDLEINYVVRQLSRDENPAPQLRNLGGLMKDVGINTFANLLAAPIFEVIKPMFGL